MSDWIRLHRDEMKRFHNKESENAHVNFKMYMSPYNIPEAVKCSFEENEKKLTIEFKYLSSSEKLEEKLINDGILSSVMLGKHSKRLYKIVLDNITKNQNIKFEIITEAVDHLANDVEDTALIENYALIKEILQHKERDICQQYA